MQYFMNGIEQRWSPRGHILKSLDLASRPQVLENWPVLGSRTALFFELLKFCGALEKFLGNLFLWRSPEKFLYFCEDLFSVLGLLPLSRVRVRVRVLKLRVRV